MPTFGSLFAGIGGIDLGLERAGWECRWQVEIDPFCQRVLAKHWPDVPRYWDIRTLTGAELERVDLIAGGFPCQPVSHAGARRGQADTRWLWPECGRLIGALRPRLALLENVPGLLAVTGGMGAVLGDLAALGYDAEWDCIPASAVGAPHRRDRVWIIGHADRDWQPAFAFDAEAPWLPKVGHANRKRWPHAQGSPGPEAPGRPIIGANHAQRWRDQWNAEPDMDRVAHGVPARMDRLRSLGNAVVPQVAEWIGRRLLDMTRRDGRPKT